MVDKSPQGYIDEDIKCLLDKINELKEYETTSSCSGRIVVINSQKKGESQWLFKSHDIIHSDDISMVLSKVNNTVWFMQEPMILHVKCEDLESAQILLGKANKIGLKKSGIISAKGFIVEIKGTERIECPISKDISKKSLFLIIDEANRKLLKTKDKIRLLENLF